MTASRMIAASDLAYASGSVTAVSDLFDPNDPNVGFGKYVDPTTGNLIATTAYHATGYIPVIPGVQYVTTGTVAANRRAYYDANKNFVSGVYDFNAGAFTIPTGAGIAFMRMTVPIANWEILKIQPGSSQLNYTPSLNRPLSNDQTLWWLRWTHARLMRLALAESGVQFGIALAGDSYTHNPARYTTRVANYLTSKYGDAGGGWCGFGFLNSGNVAPWTVGNQPSYLNGNARPSLYPVTLLGNQTSTYYTAGSADLAATLFSASGDEVDIGLPASPAISGIDLHWIGTGAGTITYGPTGTETTLNVSGTSGVTSVSALSLSGLTQTGTLKIKWASGTANLCGVNLKSAAAGVVVHKIAATGSNSGGWATGTALTGFGTSFTALGALLFAYMDGPNDQGGINYTQWANNVTTIFNKARTAVPSIDFLSLIPPENARGTNTYPMYGYAQLARNLANTLEFALHIIKFGDAGNPGEYNYNGTIPLLDTDSLHPNTGDGGALMAFDVLNAIGAWRG